MLQALKKIIKEAVEKKSVGLVEVILFGSRAKGTAKPYSDFDIAIEWKEKIPLHTMAKIREELDKLPTLKSFDLIDLKRVSGNFIETVRKTGVILYDGRKFKEET